MKKFKIAHPKDQKSLTNQLIKPKNPIYLKNSLGFYEKTEKPEKPKIPLKTSLEPIKSILPLKNANIYEENIKKPEKNNFKELEMDEFKYEEENEDIISMIDDFDFKIKEKKTQMSEIEKMEADFQKRKKKIIRM